MKRRPSWACESFEAHGDVVCPRCLAKYDAAGHMLARWDMMPPRTTFGRGWFSMGATHWFEATDATVFPSRDGRRTLAQAVCGGICDVSMTWAAHLGCECGKCLRALDKASRPTTLEALPEGDPESEPEVGEASSTKSLRLYRGVKEPYDPARVSAERLSNTDFTDCPYTALLYAAGRRGVLLILDVPEGTRRLSEELWLEKRAKRFMLWGGFDKYIVGQIPAKDLRTEIHRKGIVTAAAEDKAMVLRRCIRERLARRSASR